MITMRKINTLMVFKQVYYLRLIETGSRGLVREYVELRSPPYFTAVHQSDALSLGHHNQIRSVQQGYYPEHTKNFLN